MAKKRSKIIIWVLVGSCILNLILAVNAGQKRKDAVSQVDDLNARLAEINLRYKNAVQSYDELKNYLKEAKKDSEEQKRVSDTLKEALQEEQMKSAALKQELDNVKKPAVKSEKKQQNKQASGAGVFVQSLKDKKVDRTVRSQRNW